MNYMKHEHNVLRIEKKIIKLGGVKGDVSMRVGEEMGTVGAMKRVWGGRSVTLGVKRELYERIVVPTGLNHGV